MEEVRKRKKLFIIGVLILLVAVIGASYAYFSVNTTNNFGTHTISGTMDDVGSVALVSTGNNISLNLTAADMMQGNSDIYYIGSTTGEPRDPTSITYPFDMFVKLADVVVTGPGYYNCNYTLNITATGTNNMYTAFQGMSTKSSEQVVLGLINGVRGNASLDGYDFNDSNLFPITINKTLKGVSEFDKDSIYGLFQVINKKNINQTALANTDITMTATVTSFTCSAVNPTFTYQNTLYNNTRYDDNESLINNGYNYYLKTKSIGSEEISTEACGVINGSEICLGLYNWDKVLAYKSQLESAGAACNSTYVNDGYLKCSYGYLSFRITSDGYGANVIYEDGTHSGYCSVSGEHTGCGINS